MVTAWAPAPYPAVRRSVGRGLRLVSPDERPLQEVARPELTVVPDVREVRPRRRVSPEVRRRRTMLAVVAVCLLGLALPLGGTGGHSHAAGSALAGNGHAVEYTVQPGDSLW